MHSQRTSSTSNKLSTTGIILGIISISLSIFLVGGFIGIIGFIISLCGLRKSRRPDGCAITGIVSNSIAMYILLVFIAMAKHPNMLPTSNKQAPPTPEPSTTTISSTPLPEPSPTDTDINANIMANDIWELTLLDAKTYTEITGDFYSDTPSSGKVYMVVFLEAKNISSADEHFNMLYVNAYDGDYAVDIAVVLNDVDGYSLMGGTAAPGKKVKGYYAFEIDENWETFEFTYYELFTHKDQKLQFTIHRSDIE